MPSDGFLNCLVDPPRSGLLVAILKAVVAAPKEGVSGDRRARAPDKVEADLRANGREG